MRTDLSPLDQLLLEAAFSADDMADLVTARERERARSGIDENDKDGIALRGEAEIDYALARFVAANCAAVGEHLATPTPFVLKGGLAIYTCFAGARRSKDADLSPSGLDVEFDGLLPPELIKAPTGMQVLEPTQTTDDGWKVPVEFTATVGGDVSTIICDLNNARRVIRRPPAITRPFATPFTTAPVDVWVARPEEMIGEKISALLRRRNGRLRDLYDIDHLLARSIEFKLDRTLIREVAVEAISELLAYDNLREEMRTLITDRLLAHDDASWVQAEIERIGRNARPKDWKAQVADVLPTVGSSIEVTESLMAHWNDLRILEPKD
ncbi:MAG TPA: nucleotidyl transferase AbiEii/AbiGii toxin family protein [Candidatus Limnocylindrales bacterium]|nr:nucleotidyl transferase AbiEii/AbiGii toxin family protein [Candidatus Limnocylindrales bacterium]